MLVIRTELWFLFVFWNYVSILFVFNCRRLQIAYQIRSYYQMNEPKPLKSHANHNITTKIATKKLISNTDEKRSAHQHSVIHILLHCHYFIIWINLFFCLFHAPSWRNKYLFYNNLNVDRQFVTSFKVDNCIVM